MPSEITHTDLQPTIDLTMGVHGRDLGHVAEDVQKVVGQVRRAAARRRLDAVRPGRPARRTMEGRTIALSGEYQKMQTTFRFQAMGMAMAIVLIYFLMVALFKSYVTPARRSLGRADRARGGGPRAVTSQGRR